MKASLSSGFIVVKKRVFTIDSLTEISRLKSAPIFRVLARCDSFTEYSCYPGAVRLR